MSRRGPALRSSSIDYLPSTTSSTSTVQHPRGGPASTPQLDERPSLIDPQDLFPLLLKSGDPDHVAETATSTGARHRRPALHTGSLSTKTGSDANSSADHAVDTYMLRWGQLILSGSVLSFILGTWSMLVGPLAGHQGIWVSVRVAIQPCYPFIWGSFFF